MYEQSFYIFSNLFFSKTNNAKIITSIIFYFFSHITIISISLKSNFIKRRMYEYVWIYIVYDYICS